jgi:hypothetical protein
MGSPGAESVFPGLFTPLLGLIILVVSAAYLSGAQVQLRVRVSKFKNLISSHQTKCLRNQVCIGIASPVEAQGILLFLGNNHPNEMYVMI